MRALVVLVVLLGGCSPTYLYSPSGSGTASPRRKNCKLEVLSTPPTRPFLELGTFDLERSDEPPRTAGELKSYVRERACAVGAQALLVRSPDYRVVAALRWVADDRPR